MKREILIVDDDRAMVRTLSDVLRLKGWIPTTAHSGEEAVELVRERGLGVVLMDIKMSGIDGVEALKEIRSLRPTTRVVLMTAYSASELVQEAVRAGAMEVLSKPVALAQVLALLEEAASPPPVLVVDDEPQFLRALCDGLEAHGVVTRSACSLDDALRSIEEEDIAVVLLDLKLDGWTGQETVAAIRDLRPEVLVVLFSGYPDALRRTEAELPTGWIVGSLKKPFHPADLIGLLEGLHAC